MKEKDLTSKYERIIKKRIIEGRYRIGEKIPPLRDLAAELNCSRSVINVVIARIAVQGYLRIQKRQKTVVNDFLSSGSLNIIADIIDSDNKELKLKILESVLAARKLIEVESVRLASRRQEEEEIKTLEGIIESEEDLIREGVDNFLTIAESDFTFHNHLITMSGNTLYRIFMNSMKDVALDLTKLFYEHNFSTFPEYVACHRQILTAIKNEREAEAAATLAGILEHGEKLFIKHFREENNGENQDTEESDAKD